MEKEPHQYAVQEQQETGLTTELVKDLIDLLPNNNMEVRHGTLSAILQYTPTSQAKLMFKDTDLMAYLRKYISIPQLSKICLSTLIHFASQADYLPEYFKLIEPLILKMKQWKGLQLQLSLLLLLNISKDQQIIARIIGEQDKKGYLMEVLYTLLQREEKMRWIIVGVFVNVSSVERGRHFLVEELICIRFIQYISAGDEKLREATLKILRNCAFQWELESFASQIFKPQHHLLPNLIKLIVFLIYRQHLLHDLTHIRLILRKLFLDTELSNWEKKLVSTDKTKALSQLELGIDVMLVLSNANFKERKVEVEESVFRQLLSLLKFTDIKEETKDKLEALQIFGL